MENNSSTNKIGNNLKRLGIKTVSLSSISVWDLLHLSPGHDIISDPGINCILYKDCTLKYLGETAEKSFETYI